MINVTEIIQTIIAAVMVFWIVRLLAYSIGYGWTQGCIAAKEKYTKKAIKRHIFLKAEDLKGFNIDKEPSTKQGEKQNGME